MLLALGGSERHIGRGVDVAAVGEVAADGRVVAKLGNAVGDGEGSSEMRKKDGAR